MKIISLLLASIALCCGCASKVVYQEVLIPVRCEVEEPEFPKYDGNPVTYALELERIIKLQSFIIKRCKGE